jgi:DNA-directed RNA polymerase specialized sigma24 family protein
MNPDANFHPTHWTLVLRAAGNGAEAKAALSDLCARYYGPVVAFLNREREEDSARELAHTFFAQLLEGGLGAPDRERGRFRNFLLGALKHFLTKHRAASVAQKRGAGAEHVHMVDENETQPGFPVPSTVDDALAFDREWAHTLIARALAVLETEHSQKAEFFNVLRPWLDGGATASQADAARQLGMSETAVKVAIHRLRTRFRELVRAEINATVDDPLDAADELKHLISIVSRG